MAFKAGLPVGAVIPGVVQAWLRRRNQVARDIWLAEMARGNVFQEVPPFVQDDALDVIVQYFSAASSGVARLNLALLARVAKGQAERGALCANEFQRWVGVLSTLTRSEILFLGRLQREYGDLPLNRTRGESPEFSAYRRALLASCEALGADERAVEANASACLRTGLVVSVPVMWDHPVFRPTALLSELVALADIEGLVAAADTRD